MKPDSLLLFLEEDGKVFCWGWNKYGQVLILNPNQSSNLRASGMTLEYIHFCDSYQLYKPPLLFIMFTMHYN
jgi:hypothetical protein